MSALLTYAHNEQGELVHIDSVLNGSACNCVCPKCKMPLDAKNGGDKREHHFAHSHGYICEGAYETTLHLLAKQILLEEKAIMLPKNEEGEDKISGLVRFRSVEQEKWNSIYGFKPDIEATLENGEKIFIEFYVSHKIDEKKYKTIIENNLKCIEVDLNYLELDKNAIRKFLLRKSEHRYWIKIQEIKDAESYSNSKKYVRNEWHFKAIDYLKGLFDNCNLKILFNGQEFNLTVLGFDQCELDTYHYRHMHADILLCRSKRTDHQKDYMAICIRGRKRSGYFEYPDKLKIIDVIIRNEDDYENLIQQNCLKEDDNKFIFTGFIKKTTQTRNKVEPIVNSPTRYSNYQFDDNIGITQLLERKKRESLI